MKKLVLIAVVMLVATAAFAQFGTGPSSRETGNEPSMRTLVGQVVDKGDNPLPNAIVYLKNTKTLAVKTYIAQQDGNYRFHALSPNVDYEVHAELNGKSSDVKTLSSFDSRKEARINLRLDLK
jgi:uncharacterized GH25 family protein